MLEDHAAIFIETWSVGHRLVMVFMGSQAKYSKRRITVALRIDTPKHVSNESRMQNWYVVRYIKSLFSKLGLPLRVWQRKFFTRLERRVKKGTSLFKKKFDHLKLKLYHFKSKNIIESRGVSVMLNLGFYLFKGKQLE